MTRHPGEICPVCRVLGPPPFRLIAMIMWQAAHRALLLPLNHG